jgi:hypothetical protein
MMIQLMNFCPPPDQDSPIAFAQGAAAVQAWVPALAKPIDARAQHLARQGDALQALDARRAKNSRNRRKPPSRDGYGKGKRTES